MAFVAETEIFTDSGWKPIKDISGRDRVLVRNFIGDAEFIQPFALKKRQYNGEVIQLGGKNWSFSVTPDHIVVYDRDDMARGLHFKYEPAKDITVHNENRIYRKFRYMTPETYKRESVVIHTEFGKKYSYIANEDWFVLVAYLIERAQLVKSSRFKHTLQVFLDPERVEYEIDLLGGIFDRIGVEWTFIPYRTTGQALLRVKSNNTLASRVITRLGSSTRKEMFLPDKMIYNSSKELVDMFFEALIQASKRADTKVGKLYQYQTGNVALMKSLEKIGTLWGYGIAPYIVQRAGDKHYYGIASKNIYNVVIQGVTKTYSPRFKQSLQYQGAVYEIDLFDGQVYAREGSMPVWVNPK